MSSAEFTAFYSQFAGFTPAVVLEGYIRQANSRFSAFFGGGRGGSPAALYGA